MKARIEIEMDNAAFENGNGYELARILRGAADRVEDCEFAAPDSMPVFDTNGNLVGKISIKE